MRQPVSRAAAIIVGMAGATAVALGAFGAHALKTRLSVDALAVWHTAVEYHAWHAAALLALSALGLGRWQRVAMALFAAGIVLFSGSLYALALGAPRGFGIITPFGGVSFMAGWVAAGVALRRSSP